MAKFQPTNRNNPCPICEKVNGNCRIQEDDGILCMTYADGYGASNHPVYRFIKPTSNGGLWGLYHLRQNDNDFDREKWLKEQEIKQAQREKDKKERNKAALSIEQRNKDIQAILNQLSLNDSDHQRLRDRGLTNEQINQIGYRSVTQWQALTGRLSYGVNKRGNLNNPCDGILCPIRNRKGQLIGLRLHNPKHKENGLPKYLSFKGGNLKSGEFPIGVYGVNLASDIAGITEGLEIKPAIASYRLNIPIIGHNGSNFTSSPIQVRETLEALGASIIRLYPDGGVVFNRSVFKQYQDAIALYREWGYLVEVGWWGQVEKTGNNDIDEIGQATLDNIQYITPEQWYEIAEREKWLKRVGESQKLLNNLSYTPDILINQPYFPTLEKLNSIHRLPLSGIFNLVGPKGSGKSTTIRALKEFYKAMGYKILSITPRVALGRAQAFEWEINWIGDIGVDGIDLNFMARNTDELGICFDSVHRLAGKDLSKTLVIFDESELGFNHLATSGTLKDKRSKALKMIETIISECLNNNGLVLLSDADLTDVSVNYVKSFAPKAPIFTIINEAKPKQWEIDFYTDGKTAASVKQELFDDIENGLKLAVTCDNQAEAEALDREIAKTFSDKKITRIDRTTTETDAGRKFVEQINKHILLEKPDILIFTGSMGTGVSIDGKIRDENTGDEQYHEEVYNWFDKVYGLFFGVIEPSQCRQYLARVRKPVPRIVWAKEQGYSDESCKSFLPDVVKRNLFKNTDQTLNIIDLAKELADGDTEDLTILEALNKMMNPETKTWENPHIDLYCQMKARRNYGLSQLAIQLRQELIEEGHDLTDYSSDDFLDIADRIKATKLIIKQEQATAIAAALDIPIEAARAIERKATTTEDERNQAAKAFIKTELPDIELTADFIYNWTIKDNRKALNAVKLFFFAQNPDIAHYLDKKEFRHRLKQFADGAIFLPDIKTYSNKVKVINDLDFFSYIDPNRKYKGTDADLIELKQRALFMKHRVYTALGLNITEKTDPMMVLTKIGKRVGIYFNKEQIREGDFRFYEFTINTEKLNDPTRLAILNSLSVKYAEILTETNVESVTQLSCSYINQGKLSDKNLTSDNNVIELKNNDEFNHLSVHNDQDLLERDRDDNKPTETNTDAAQWHNYTEGQRVWLWRYFEGQEIWLPATIRSIALSLLHAVADGGFYGRYIERHTLNLIAPMVDQSTGAA